MSEKSERSGFVRDLPTLIGAVAVALAIRTLLVQPFYVPSDSMLPTLLVGDHVFVNKFLFGAGMTDRSPGWLAISHMPIDPGLQRYPLR